MHLRGRTLYNTPLMMELPNSPHSKASLVSWQLDRERCHTRKHSRGNWLYGTFLAPC